MDIAAILPQGYTWVFLLIAVIAGCGYAVQGTLVASYGRRFDPLLVTSCRNLSFIVTLSPLLLFAPVGSLQSLLPFVGYLLLAGLFGGLAVTLIFVSQRTFPVGIVSGFQQMTQIWLLLLSYFVFEERIGLPASYAIVLILCAVIFLAIRRSSMPHLKEVNLLALFYVFLFPFFLGTAFLLVAWVGRQSNLLAAGYAWEVSIGVFAFAIFWIRKLLIKNNASKKEQKLTAKDVFWIGLYSSGTLLGTGGSMLLYGIASPGVGQTAISSIQMISMSLLAILLYKERLKLGQWLAIFVILAGLGILKIFAA